ncbi:hypothetical protein QM588_05165 [Rhodococcus sp. IEGM 1354]|uniref:hypothetical protein n=1 Tax=Rhodococcus sp. IEGM 1354 TaxID=3047088 RepID=UPI0024B6C1AE|nr:hypothetical protein [Rhodococcus sp. IEGM 1354]MDI9929787.1 hypothetical protein [Rhodococcus sp. IEGM 1354]
MTTTATPLAIATTTLALYPTTDSGDFAEFTFTGNGTDEHDAFSYLYDFAVANNMSLRHDPESDATMTGYYVERHSDGVQVFAAIIK